MTISRQVLAVVAVMIGSLTTACTQYEESDEIVPHAAAFSISLGTLSQEDVLNVLGRAAEKAGIPPDNPPKLGQLIAPDLLLLGSYAIGIYPSFDVTITGRVPVVCIGVITTVAGDDSERQSSEITAALRAAVEHAFPDAATSDRPCPRSQSSGPQ